MGRQEAGHSGTTPELEPPGRAGQKAKNTPLSQPIFGHMERFLGGSYKIKISSQYMLLYFLLNRFV